MDLEGWGTKALAGADQFFSSAAPRALIIGLDCSGVRYSFDAEALNKSL